MNGQAYSFLPECLNSLLLRFGQSIFELRIRADKPIYANINGEYAVLTYKNLPVVLTKRDIADIVLKACDNSIYAYNESIMQGYITKNGIRIGLAGDCVIKKEEVSSICNFSSLCVRFPHEVYDCSSTIYNLITTDNGIKNSLIISAPGEGKTTALRDLARKISDNTKKNVLVIDEKGELYSQEFNLGETTDVIIGCTKKFGLYNAVKNLCPDVLITDELTTEDDVNGISFAIKSGISVIASVHGIRVSDVEKKRYLHTLFDDKIIDFVVVIKKNNGKFDILQTKKYTER